jgi:hypothetical protein
MHTTIEMKERISRDANVIRFISTADQSNINIDEFHARIAQAVRDNQIEFLDAVMIDYDRSLIIKMEKETYDCYLKLNLARLDLELVTQQNNIIKEYCDKMLKEGGDINSLKKQVNDKLNFLIDNAIEKAIELELKIQSELDERFIFLKCQPLDKLSLKIFYLKYFEQDVLTLPLPSITDTLVDFVFRLSDLNGLVDKIESDYNDICDDLSAIHINYRKRKHESKVKLKDMLKDKNLRNKIPLAFQYDASDDKAIGRLIELQFIPDLIDPETGDTLLHIAIDANQAHILGLLLDRGADPFKPNKNGVTAHTKASLLPNPKFLKIINKSTEDKQLKDIHTEDVSKELLDIINPVLEQAKKLLDEYGIILEKRKSYSIVLRILLQYEQRIKSRSQEYATYSEKLRIAERDLDPNVFFNEVVKTASIAKRGLLNNSSLHDRLVQLMQTFLKDFDAHGYNKLRQAKELSPKVDRYNISPKEDMIKILKQKLNASHEEIKILRARGNREESEKISQPPQKASTKQSFF